MDTERKFIGLLYGAAAGKNMASIRHAFYTNITRGKAVCVKTPPPTHDNLSYHFLRVQYQDMLWKAADQ